MERSLAPSLLLFAVIAGACAGTQQVTFSTADPNAFVPQGPAGHLAELKITGDFAPELCGPLQGTRTTVCADGFEETLREGLENSFNEWFRGEGRGYRAEFHVQQFYVRRACGERVCNGEPILKYRYRLLREDGSVVVQFARTARAPRQFGNGSDQLQRSMDSLMSKVLETIIGSLPNVPG